MISFSQLTKSDYDSLSSYMPDRLYFLSDTGELKLNGVDYGASELSSLVPSGGTVGQVLTKTETGSEWADAQGGSDEPVDYLTFTAQEANSTVALNKNTDDPSLSAVLEYSNDGETWTNYEWSGTAGLVITLANVGDYVKFRGDNATFSINASSLYYLFAITGSVGASGNINTLMSKNGNAVLTTYCFTYLFKQCTGLISAPEMPSTELADNCYFNMFNGCTGLTSAPELPATVLTNGCYNRMFKDCSGLISAPEMTATSFITDCYTQTFRGCTSLSSVTVHWTTWPTYSGSIVTTNWLQNASATGTFYCPYGLPIIRDASHIPAGWNVVYTDVPESVISEISGKQDAITAESKLAYSLLSGTPSIPTKTSDLTNDSGFITQSSLDTLSASIFAALYEMRQDINAISAALDLIKIETTPLTLVANGNDVTISLNKTITYDRWSTASIDKLSAVALEYSLDNGNTWNEYTWDSEGHGDEINLLELGDTVMFRGDNENIGYMDGPSPLNERVNLQFSMDTDVIAKGNVMSLLSKNCDKSFVPGNAFGSLFKDCSALTDVSNLVLPAMSVGDYGYCEMFMNTSITSMPKLPATTLGSTCYGNMFDGALVSGKVDLPAINGANYCYYQMFSECVSITDANIALQTIPQLGLYEMFKRCTNLSGVTVNFTVWNSNATGYWLNEVAANGTFTCPTGLDVSTRDESHVPANWTIETF